MKKNTLFNLIALGAVTLTLVSCGRKLDDPDKLPDQNVPSESTTSKGEEHEKPGQTPDKTLTIVDFNGAMAQSKPTKVSTTVIYYVPALDITLNFLSVLNIEYGPVIEAEYKYTYQKLNEIGTSDSMISTFTGTNYAKGNMFGEFKDGQIHWNVGAQEDIDLLQFNLTDQAMPKPNINPNKYVLSGAIEQTELGNVFNNNIIEGMSDVFLTIGVKDNLSQVNFVNCTYNQNNNIDKQKARVAINTNYYYDYVEVNIPENL